MRPQRQGAGEQARERYKGKKCFYGWEGQQGTYRRSTARPTSQEGLERGVCRSVPEMNMTQSWCSVICPTHLLRHARTCAGRWGETSAQASFLLGVDPSCAQLPRPPKAEL